MNKRPPGPGIPHRTQGLSTVDIKATGMRQTATLLIILLTDRSTPTDIAQAEETKTAS
jgi:hypothetical protein